VQTAIYTRLAGYAPLMGVATGIYDHAPQTATFPYVVVGDDTAVAFNTHSSVGGDHTVTVHTWSRERGRAQTKTMLRHIYDALNRYALTVSGATMIDCQCEHEQSFLDEDGLTRHGVARYRVLTDG
jgi:hypothetical protein